MAKTKLEVWSARTIVQKLCALSIYNSIVNRGGTASESIKTKKIELERRVRFQIKSWGGRPKIDEWLRVHDPEHSTTDIKGVDWKFLTRK